LGNPSKLDEYRPPPCTPGERSRWVPTTNCTGGPTIGTGTQAIFENLLHFSPDTTNPQMRDIFFPVTGAACDSGDVNSFDFKIQVDTQCWENVHPDHLQVYGKPWCARCPCIVFLNNNSYPLLASSFQLLG
jgi:hypothetical protein